MGPVSEGAKRNMETSLSAGMPDLLAQLSDPRASVLSAVAPAISASISNGMVSVSLPSTWGSGSDVTQFDLASSEEAKFFTELQYAYNLADRLNTDAALNNLVKDDVPDFYALTFSALSSLVDKYGRASQEVSAALRVLDAALPKILQKFQTLYPSRVVTEMVLLGSHPSFTAYDAREVVSALTQLLPHEQHIEEYFPYLYLPASQELTEMCDVMSLRLEHLGSMVYCPEAASRPTTTSLYPRFRLAAANSTNNTLCVGGANPASNCVELYQIELWISIGLAFAAFWASASIAYMSFKKDTLLYGSFNPNWEDRKRR